MRQDCVGFFRIHKNMAPDPGVFQIFIFFENTMSIFNLDHDAMLRIRSKEIWSSTFETVTRQKSA